jgi:hypothetical protein
LTGSLYVLTLISDVEQDRDEQHKIAGAIVAHLEDTNWNIERGPEPVRHSRIMGNIK